MGTWSVTLYGNDAAADIRGDVKDLLRAPLDEAGIIAALTESYPSLANPRDEEHSDLWLVVADQFHSYGIAAPVALATAAAIIDSGLDLDTKRRLGMGERDLGKRAKLLTELRAKWSRPHPKPFKRTVQAKPDAWVFDVGDAVAFPISKRGGTINPYFAKAENDPAWSHVGFGAMVVLARGHRYGIFAWYGVARLNLRNTGVPSLAECAAATIEAESSLLDERVGERPRLAVYGGRLTPLFARKMRFEVVGHLKPNDATIRGDFGVFFAPTFVPGACLADGLTGCIGTRGASTFPVGRYLSLTRV
jgi:hypothetical protein